MKKKWPASEERYFGIGVFRPKTQENIGTLWRTAYVMGASFIFIIDGRYKKMSSDVLKVWSKIPLFQFDNIEAFMNTVPYSCKLVGIEIDNNASPLITYQHPPRAFYLLGSEDNGLTKELKDKCHDLVILPGDTSLNVSVAGSIVIYDRVAKLGPDSTF